MKEQLVESATTWYVIGIMTGILASFFFYIILNLKNDEIRSLKRELEIENAKRMAVELKDREMRKMEIELERANKEIEKLGGKPGL